MSVRNYTRCFLFIQYALFITFIYMDTLNGGSTIFSNLLKYVGILLCSLYIFIYRILYPSQPYNSLIQLSLALVLFCDCLLLFTPYFTSGILIFCLIQFTYHLHLRPGRPLLPFYSLIILLTVTLVLVAQALAIPIHLMELSAIFYFITLSANIALALVTFNRTPTTANLFFCLGLIFCLICDINVGIVNMIHLIPDTAAFKLPVHAFSSVAMWTFYFPAQILITLSPVIPYLIAEPQPVQSHS